MREEVLERAARLSVSLPIVKEGVAILLVLYPGLTDTQLLWVLTQSSRYGNSWDAVLWFAEHIAAALETEPHVHEPGT